VRIELEDGHGYVEWKLYTTTDDRPICGGMVPVTNAPAWMMNAATWSEAFTQADYYRRQEARRSARQERTPQ
jgi:hypothetical protein